MSERIKVHPNWHIVLWRDEIWVQHGWVVKAKIGWHGGCVTVGSVRDSARIRNADSHGMNGALFRSEAGARAEIRDRLAQKVRSGQNLPKENDMPEIETLNKFMVGVIGDDVIVGAATIGRINPRDALLLAAYLVTMAEIQADRKFEDVLKAVQNA